MSWSGVLITPHRLREGGGAGLCSLKQSRGKGVATGVLGDNRLNNLFESKSLAYEIEQLAKIDCYSYRVVRCAPNGSKPNRNSVPLTVVLHEVFPFTGLFHNSTGRNLDPFDCFP